MKKLSAIIIDDEQRARSVLKSLLARNCDQVEVVKEAANLQEGVEFIKTNGIDLVFLDVQMPVYAGYEIATFFEKIDFEIIFVTAFDHFAIKAFELNAIDYLVKPINRQRLVEAVDKANNKILNSNQLQEYQHILETMRDKKMERIIIPESGNRRVVEVNDIVAIEADGSYCKLFLENDQEIILSKNLKHFEGLLEEHTQFFRSHRAWVVNLDKVNSLNKTELTITLKNGLTSKLSRSKLDEFEKVFL